METFKPHPSFASRAALFASVCLIAPIQAGELKDGASLLDSEHSRRSIAIQEAQVLLTKGDEAYTAGRYEAAVEAYAGARELIPNAPISAALLDATTQRYVQASVEYARGLAKVGDVAGAKAAMDRVLAKSIAPNNPAALAYRNQLDDPIRTNPALTKEHTKQVDEVRRLLYTAQGAFDLGDFDKAITNYEAVIRIDSTNAAARRGLEQVAAEKSHYAKSSHDHARAEMLSQVDAQWETAVPGDAPIPKLESGEISQNENDFVSVKNKLDRIIIPKLVMDQVTLSEALEFLRIKSVENDTLDLNPTHKGVNFTINLGPQGSPVVTRANNQRFDLHLSNVPLSQVLKYITDNTQTSYTTDDYAVTIVPLGSSSSELVTRTYRVPPDFISSISSGAATPKEAADPFAQPSKSGGLLTTRIGAQDALAQLGVSFPQGTSASYTPASNMLRVINTPQSQDFISQIIETMTRSEPVVVSVNVTMIKVRQNDLEELGFDWLLNNFGFGGKSWVPGQDKLNLTGGSVGNGRPITDIEPLPGVGAPQFHPITSANRSGDFATSGNSLDDLITNQNGRQTQNSAPGVLAVRGEINDATVQMLMRGLDQKKGTDVMARPAVVTRSGQSSTISVLRNFIYPDEYEPPELPNTVGTGVGNIPTIPAMPTSFKVHDVGVTMEVLPVVDENKRYVNLTLNPVLTDFDGFVNYGSPINTTTQGIFGTVTTEVTPNAILQPVFSVNRLNTSVDILDGATMVIGGLLQEQVERVDDKTPILGSLPLVGRLFESKVTKSSRSAVIFLVTVNVMDPTGRHYRDR